MENTPLTIIVTYKTKPGMAKAYFEKVVSSGVAEGVRKEEGNKGYNFYMPMEEEDTIILIEKWDNKACADAHAGTDNVKKLASFKGDYVLETQAVRYCKFE
ncbi:MAG: antibiotic biosynthesis monooxygenase [Clostridia bacterium]|nr:antibiotic biosynthesis monooxygenase [Clostridia bacterium]